MSTLAGLAPPVWTRARAKAAYGYDPRTGRELLKVQYNDGSVAPRPLLDRGLALIITSLDMRFKKGIQVSPDRLRIPLQGA
jgi:hypothetical protein